VRCMYSDIKTCIHIYIHTYMYIYRREREREREKERERERQTEMGSVFESRPCGHHPRQGQVAPTCRVTCSESGWATRTGRPNVQADRGPQPASLQDREQTPDGAAASRNGDRGAVETLTVGIGRCSLVRENIARMAAPTAGGPLSFRGP
jgi:hypothetical protein